MRTVLPPFLLLQTLQCVLSARQLATSNDLQITFKKVKQQKACLRELGNTDCSLFGFISCLSWRSESFLHFSGLLAPAVKFLLTLSSRSCVSRVLSPPPPPPSSAGHLHSECLCEWPVRCLSKGLHKFLD